MTLLVFALNIDPGIRHTDLTRAQGETPELPPLAEWLGVDDLDTDRIELFPVADLGDLRLSQYLVSAYDADPADQVPRLDALDGSVLIVPARAMTGAPKPGAEATLIATLETARPDHSARLDPAPVPPPAAAAKTQTDDTPKRPVGWIVAVALALAAIGIWWLT